jgi:hypothetical protein
MENKESFSLRYSKCETPGLLQNQTRTITITITVAVTAHQKFNMKTGYSTTLSLCLRRIELFPLISLQEQRRAPLQWTLQNHSARGYSTQPRESNNNELPASEMLRLLVEAVKRCAISHFVIVQSRSIGSHPPPKRT